MRPGVLPGCRHGGLGSGFALSAAALPWRFSGLAPVAKCARLRGHPAAAPVRPYLLGRRGFRCRSGVAWLRGPSTWLRGSITVRAAVHGLPARSLPAPGAACVGGGVGPGGLSTPPGSLALPAQGAWALALAFAVRPASCVRGGFPSPWALFAPLAPWGSRAFCVRCAGAPRASRPSGGLRLCGFFFPLLGRVRPPGAGLLLRCPPRARFCLPHVLAWPPAFHSPGVAPGIPRFGRCRRNGPAWPTSARGAWGELFGPRPGCPFCPFARLGACSVRVRRCGRKPPRGAGASPCWRGAAPGGVPASAPGG